MSAAHDHRPSEPCGQVHRIQGFHNLFAQGSPRRKWNWTKVRGKELLKIGYMLFILTAPPNVIVKRKEIFLESGKPNRTFSNIQIVWNLEYECSAK